MGKIDAKEEKRLRNEEYAKKFAKPYIEDDTRKQLARKGGKYGKWCRREGHPPECQCSY